MFVGVVRLARRRHLVSRFLCLLLVSPLQDGGTSSNLFGDLPQLDYPFSPLLQILSPRGPAQSAGIGIPAVTLLGHRVFAEPFGQEARWSAKHTRIGFASSSLGT